MSRILKRDLMMESSVMATINERSGEQDSISWGGCRSACTESQIISLIGTFEPQENVRKEVKATGRPCKPVRTQGSRPGIGLDTVDPARTKARPTHPSQSLTQGVAGWPVAAIVILDAKLHYYVQSCLAAEERFLMGLARLSEVDVL